MSLFRPRPRLGRSSVKEGFDNLPSGICFADGRGMIILCNRQMHSLCRELLGTDLQHMEELRRGLAAPRPGVEAADQTALLFRFPDGKLWQFAESAVTEYLCDNRTLAGFKLRKFHNCKDNNFNIRVSSAKHQIFEKYLQIGIPKQFPEQPDALLVALLRSYGSS